MTENDGAAILVLMIVSFILGLAIGFPWGRLRQIDKEKSAKTEGAE
jgi:hypothetical protein